MSFGGTYLDVADTRKDDEDFGPAGLSAAGRRPGRVCSCAWSAFELGTHVIAATARPSIRRASGAFEPQRAPGKSERLTSSELPPA